MPVAEKRFNLLDEPWVPCTTKDGNDVELSLLDAFRRSDELASLSFPLPTQSLAVTRLMLAFLHRALEGPATVDDWAELWEAKGLPMDRIEAYAATVHDRFYLVHPEHPFYQARDLRTAKNEMGPLSKLVADIPDGAQMFTQRTLADLRHISFAEAASWLIHVHAFDTAGIKSGTVGDETVKGGKSYPIGPGSLGRMGPLLLQGVTLRDTLLLNLIASDATNLTIGGPADLPAWERSAHVDGRRGREVHGILQEDPMPDGAIDVYTWQSRRVRFAWDDNGATGVVLTNGDRLTPHNKQDVEPHTLWRYSEPQSKKLGVTVFMPVAHDPSRQVWRGLARILPAERSALEVQTKEGKIRPPEAQALAWAATLVGEGVLAEDYPLRIGTVGLSLGSQEAVVEDLVDDSLAVPAVALAEGSVQLRAAMEKATRTADAVAKTVGELVDNLSVAAGGDRGTKADAAREGAFAALDQPLRAWLAGLTLETDRATADIRWQRTARRVAEESVKPYLDSIPPSAFARGMKTSATSRPMTPAYALDLFRRDLRKHLPGAFPTTEPTQKEGSDD